MKIITIVGARPQFVKAAVVSRAIAKAGGITEKIIHTGQHYDENMSDVFFTEMEIPRPHFNLHVGGLNHGAMTGRMLEQIEAILVEEKPDFVLVYGDTNSTLAGALAAQKLHIKVSHVEAGLRSYNMRMPEEVNRILTDRVSSLLFCPTQSAVNNLKAEGYDKFDIRIVQTGDVMYDAALFYSSRSRKPLFNVPGSFVLATLHRAENTDDPARLSFLVNSLNDIHRKVPVILPLHPRTRKKIEESGLAPEFQVCDPVSYFEMLYLLQQCSLVMTDSGGLQKESYFFGKHCVILREETEWPELVDEKINFLYHTLPSFTDDVVELSEKRVQKDKELYGKGNSGELIVDTLKSF
ncbi:MAG: UDP-N-acetylglucosamine 2-epimerase [Flaviaesturariibacter sp.]|nr:UDP-N-acetylglucosamine 2-epimerase [Flaviaesturariibacter sp.]